MGYYWHNNLLKSLNLNINLWNSFINMAMVAELLSSYIYGICLLVEHITLLEDKIINIRIICYKAFMLWSYRTYYGDSHW